VSRLVLILGDQLSEGLSALRAADRAHDRVVMAEVMEEARYVPHHPQKIALFLAAMRKFAAHLQGLGWQVAYTRLDDPENTGSIAGEVLRRAAETGCDQVLATRPGEWRLIVALEGLPLQVSLLPDDRFLCSDAEFAAWAKGRKMLRMEHFYRDMRRKTGLLMEGDAPAGGRWNFDAENRKPAAPDLFRAPPRATPPDALTEEVLALVETRFAARFGRLRPFGWATDRAGALAVLDDFLRHRLPRFGDEQDAMLRDDPYLSHALISPYLNLGLLDPLEVCQAVEVEWRSGRVALNAAEGFIRQIIGWREYVRGIYFLAGPDYTSRNALGHHRRLPAAYWGGATRMACLAAVVGQTRDLAYAHHIQRLMIAGNFALLIGADPAQVHEWYLSVYIDAVEWVEAPNTLGMSQFADGGLLASKPYVASAAYVSRMSDYCRGCAYRPDQRTGEGACPLNALYWHFLHRHRGKLQSNPRLAPMYRTLDMRTEAERAAMLAAAETVLARLDAGEVV
jgi:deoxyribodipyrimidine photolyase-related protein